METCIGIVKSMSYHSQFHTSGGIMTCYDMVIHDKGTDKDRSGHFYTMRTDVKEGSDVRYEFHPNLRGDKFKKLKIIE